MFLDNEPEIGVEAATIVGSTKSSPVRASRSSTSVTEGITGVDETAVDAASEADELCSTGGGSSALCIDSPLPSSHASMRDLELVEEDEELKLPKIKSFPIIGSPYSDDYSLPDRAPSEISDSFSLVEDASDAIKTLSHKMQSTTLQEVQRRSNATQKEPIEPITQVCFYIFVLYFIERKHFRFNLLNYGRLFMSLFRMMICNIIILLPLLVPFFCNLVKHKNIFNMEFKKKLMMQ